MADTKARGHFMGHYKEREHCICVCSDGEDRMR